MFIIIVFTVRGGLSDYKGAIPETGGWYTLLIYMVFFFFLVFGRVFNPFAATLTAFLSIIKILKYTAHYLQ